MIERPKVLLSASTYSERNGAIGAVSDAIKAVGGWIDDVNFFSNISVALRFFLKPSKGNEFSDLLKKIDVRLNPAEFAHLLSLSEVYRDKEVLCSLNITFVRDERDLRQHIPSVPG